MRRLVACAAALLAGTAAAQARRVAAIAVELEGAPQGPAEQGAYALAHLLQSDPRFEWVSPAIQIRDDGPVREAKALEATRLYREARDALDEMDLAKAAATADKAIKFHESSDLSQGAKGLVDSLALRALIAFAKGDKAGFTADAQRVLAIAPDYAWDPSRLTPPAQAALEPLTARAKSAPGVSLEVASTPLGAWAFVDGEFRGITPVTAGGLKPGSHYITIQALGYELGQEKTFAGSGGAVSLALQPAPRGKSLLTDVAAARDGLEKNEPSAAGKDLCRLVLADEVLIAGYREAKGQPTAVLARVLADGTVIGTLTHPGTDWTGLAKELLGKGVPAPVRAETPPEPEVTVVSHAGRRPVGWACAAAAAAMLGGGIALGSASKSRAEQANQVPQLDTATYNRFASQAKVEAGAADALFVLATAAAGASIYLLLTGYADSGEGIDSVVPPVSLLPQPGGAAVTVGGRF